MTASRAWSRLSDEGVQVRQIGGVGCGDPRIETVGTVFAWPEQIGETADESRPVDHLRAGDDEAVQQAPVLFAEGAGTGEQQPGKPARGDGQAIGFDAALGDVVVERCLPVLHGRSSLGPAGAVGGDFFQTASPKLCRRCHRSAIWMASGNARRIASA